MAKCSWCEQEMRDSNTIGCAANVTVEYPDGSSFPSIPYGEEERYGKGWMDDDSQHRCHDCNVKVGGHHHPGCDVEECPKCRRQLISCGCLNEDEEEE